MKKNIIGTLAGFGAGIALVAGMGACLPDAPAPVETPVPVETSVPVVIPDELGAPITLPPCVTEDYSPEFGDCYWDATVRGNGQGESFILWGGTIYYGQ